MYNRDDFKIVENRILIKNYSDSKINGVKQYNWETFLEVNRSKCVFALYPMMLTLLETLVRESN